MDIYTATKLYWHKARSLSPNGYEALLYFYLVERCNLAGWKNPFPVPTRDVALLLNLPNKTIIEIRNRLKEKGLIDFKPGRKKADPPIYCLAEFGADGTLSFPLVKEAPKPDHTNSRLHFLTNSEADYGLETEAKTEPVTDMGSVELTDGGTDGVTKNVTKNVTKKVTKKVTILKDYKTKKTNKTFNIVDVDARESEKNKIKDDEKARDQQPWETRCSEAEKQSRQIRMRMLSQQMALESLAARNHASLDEVKEAMEEVLTDWIVGGVVHKSQGEEDIADAILHLRRLIPIKLSIWRRDRNRDLDQQQRKTSNTQNYAIYRDKYANQRAVEPRCKDHASFNSTF